VVLYLLVTGRLPFTGETPYEVEEAIRHTEPPPMARYANGVSAELERITKKLLAKDASHRYQSAHEVRTDLEQLRGVPSPPPVPPPPVRALLVAIGAVLVVTAAVLAYFLWRPWKALAVVPFVNQTGDPRLDYLGDGIAAGVTALMINGSHMSLAASSSVQQIPPEKRTAKNLKHELGVDVIVAGSVVNNAGVLHLDLELVEGQHGWAIWAKGYDYDVSASDEMQRQIVLDLIDRLSRVSEHARTPPPRSTRSRVPQAQDLELHAASVLEDPDNANGPEQALAALDQALKLDPDFALAWAWRSRALWRLWDLRRNEESLRLAEEAADRAVQLNPELLDARLARAQIYRAKGRYAFAIRELTGVLAINPNWDDAEVHLAAAYRDSGAFALAEYHFRHATQVRPGYWRNWNSLGDVRYMRGDHAGAREAYARVISLAPERNIGYTRLALVETVDAHYDAAIELYDRLPKPVEDGDAMANMGVLYMFKRRLEDARRYLGRAAQLKPRDVDLWINLGDLHTRADRPDSAQACYEKALQLADEQLHVVPRNRILQVQRIQCLAKVGDCDDVHAAFSARADTIASGNADLTHRLAKAYALCGLRAEALVAVKKAIELGFSPTLLHDEDDFAALMSDPEFPKSRTERR
jgi:tetratricopeptide (TPR) repeat protein